MKTKGLLETFPELVKASTDNVCSLIIYMGSCLWIGHESKKEPFFKASIAHGMWYKYHCKRCGAVVEKQVIE